MKFALSLVLTAFMYLVSVGGFLMEPWTVRTGIFWLRTPPSVSCVTSLDGSHWHLVLGATMPFVSTAAINVVFIFTTLPLHGSNSVRTAIYIAPV